MKKHISLLLIFLLLASVFIAGCEPLPQANTPDETAPQQTTEGEAAAKPPYELREKSGMDAKRGVYYEIFVRAFADSDGDGIGDFNGVTAKLDYLKELGIDGIWLMPVNESDTYHGYDIIDYSTVNSDYGTEADFKNLLEEAHKRDIKIIMDFVINHTSSAHPWFVSSADPDSEYREYYQWRTKDDPDYDKNDTSPWGSKEWHRKDGAYYFAMFWDDMPDLNYDSAKVRDEIKTAAKKWLDMGIDGFRLDAAMHIYGDNENKHVDQLEKNLEWWNEFAIACQESNPDVYLVGEAWQGEEVLAEYAQPFDTKFNFGFEEVMIQSVQEEQAMYSADQALSAYYKEILDAHYAASDDRYIDGVFGTNHDQDRIMSQMDSTEKAQLTASIYLTLPGNPYIYYGEEIGMKGAKPDENIREPFVWSADKSDMDSRWKENEDSSDTVPLAQQLNDTNSMYSFYKNLISLRKGSAALSKGDFTDIPMNNTSVMAYSRSHGGETVQAYHNFSRQKQTVSISKITGEVLYSRGSGSTAPQGQTAYESITIAPYGTVMITVKG